jgi:hypothetical protein
MSREQVTELANMTGAEIAAWCAENKRMVMIDYAHDAQGVVHPMIRSVPEPAALVDLPALLRRQAE